VSSQIPKPAKAPYHSPQLIVYGDIREITRAGGSTSKVRDGGAKPNTKTH
jgi:hypothetical protein